MALVRILLIGIRICDSQTVRSSDEELLEKLNRTLALMCPIAGIKPDSMTANCCGGTLNSGTLPDDNHVTSYQKCLFPDTNQHHEFQTTRSFQIIVKPPRNGCVSSKTTNTAHDSDILLSSDFRQVPATSGCADTNSPSFLPAFAKSTKLLYSSVDCARCHGATDAKPWQAMIECEGVVQLPSERCRVTFKFLGNLEDILHLECFTPHFSICQDNTDFPIPKSVELSVEEITKGCAMSVFPRFNHWCFYKNVFCSICHDLFTGLTLPIRSCRTPSAGTTKLFDMKFTRFLHVQDGSDNARMRGMSTLDDKQICVTNKVCFQVLCPLGQIRVRDGHRTECRMDGILWKAPRFRVALKLTFDEEIPVNRSMLVDLISRDLLKSPWPNSWKLNCLYRPYSQDKRLLTTETLPDIDIIDHSRVLFAELFFVSQRINPQYLIQQVKDSVNKYWYMQFGEENVRVIQSLAEFRFINTKVFYIDDVGKILAFRLLKTDANGTDNPPERALPVFEPIIIVHDLTVRHNYITKLFLCHQVELPSADFVIYPANEPPLIVGVLHRRSGQMFYQLEHQLVKSDSGSAIRLCLDDILPMYMSQNRGRVDHSPGVIMLIWSLTVVLVNAVVMF